VDVEDVVGVAGELGLAGAGVFAVRPERRKARAGDDGEFGGGSGISQAKAAGGTEEASGETPSGLRPSGAGAEEPESDERAPGDVVPDDPGADVVPAADAGVGAGPAGFRAASAG
jgi:hypothetical protein